MLQRVLRIFAFSMTVLAAAPSVAHDTLSLDEVAEAFGWNFDSEIEVQTIADGFHVLFGVGGNIAVSIGSQGVLVVDDQFPQMMPKINAAIAELGGGAIDFAVNTHWHFDHAEGNLALGPEGTWLISQANSRDMMMSEHVINLVALSYKQQVYPAAALPVITFDDRMQFHFNGEQIELLHFGPAHTTGDTAVIFRGRNAVHLGDVFNNAGYPFIDADNGGEIDGVIGFCEAVLGVIDSATVVIPGHGPVTDYAALAAYIDMLKTVRDRISKLIDSGADLEAVIAAKPTAGYDETYGDPGLLVNRAYTSLTN
ncbi:MAG: MBL fold metallo-hydrolase [Gammaproteobacteria bacterium]|nr:MBL fold metallo-hydrolase [Gammaproteobacteria bacterium]